MNIKTLALMAAAALAATRAQALVDISAFGGYTTLNMSDFNGLMDKSDASYKSDPLYSGINTTKFASGFYVGGEVGFSVLPFLKIGPRLEYIQATSASQNYSHTVNGTSTNTYDANLVPVMVGLSADAGFPLTGLAVKGGLYGGYGMAKFLSATNNNGTKSTGSATGNGFVAEVAGQARWGFLPFLSLGLDLGYRLANMTQMTDDRTGTVMKKNASDNLNMDFSGLNVGGSLSFNF